MAASDMESIDGELFRRVLTAGTIWVGRKRDRIDALNVFPVPDGDTGTNMYLTLLAATRAASREPGTDLASVSRAAASGALLGARGNSGVILSQFFRGVAETLSGASKNGLDTALLSRALAEGYRMAVAAVNDPVEGTILTVMRRSAAAAMLAAERGENLENGVSIVLAETRLAVSETPRQLPLLKAAGVVDAGGQGYLYFWEGIWRFVSGKSLGGLPTARSSAESLPPDVPLGEIDGGYCTEFLLREPTLAREAAGKALEKMGSSLVLAEAEGMLKVHVHTDDPGTVLTWAVAHGSLDGVKVDNMRLQAGRSLPETSPWAEAAAEGRSAAVVVCSGAGMEDLLRSLGASAVVRGGQTMNPSVEDLLQAVDRLPQREVVILPNNGNILMAASRLPELTDKDVRVLPSEDPAQGAAAMLSFDPGRSARENFVLMSEALERVGSGEVTQATRSVTLDGVNIRRGDYLGLSGGKAVFAGRNLDEVVLALLERFPGGWSLATLYYGSDVDHEEARALAELIPERFPGAEVETVDGGQPHYFYLVAVE